MQPCGLRNLARPWGQLSFGLKAGRVAGYARGTLAERGLKKHSCHPTGCGIWRAFGGDGRLASRPGGLRTASAASWPKGSKKTFMQPCGLRDLACPWGRLSFGLKAGRVADRVRGILGPKGSKKHSCNLAGCGNWRVLGGDFRLASRPGGLRTTSAVPWPKEARFGA